MSIVEYCIVCYDFSAMVELRNTSGRIFLSAIDFKTILLVFVPVNFIIPAESCIELTLIRQLK